MNIYLQALPTSRASDSMAFLLTLWIYLMVRLGGCVAVILALASFSASAVTQYQCVLTHHTQSDDGSDVSEVVNKNAAVYDAGNTFSFSPDGSKLITSPELTDIIGKDNQPMKAGAQDNLMYIHTKDSFVVATQTEGYVYGDCKLNTAK